MRIMIHILDLVNYITKGSLVKVSLLIAYYFSSRLFAQKMVHSGVTENTSFEHFPVCYNQLRYTKSCQFYCRYSKCIYITMSPLPFLRY